MQQKAYQILSTVEIYKYTTINVYLQNLFIIVS